MIEYQIRDGRQARVFTDAGEGAFPLLGAYRAANGRGWIAAQWARDGAESSFQNNLSLVMRGVTLVTRVRLVLLARHPERRPVMQFALPGENFDALPQGCRLLPEQQLVWSWKK